MSDVALQYSNTVRLDSFFVKLTSYGTVGRNFRYALPVTVSDERVHRLQVVYGLRGGREQKSEPNKREVKKQEERKRSDLTTLYPPSPSIPKGKMLRNPGQKYFYKMVLWTLEMARESFSVEAVTRTDSYVARGKESRVLTQHHPRSESNQQRAQTEKLSGWHGTPHSTSLPNYTKHEKGKKIHNK
ncbi:hypothetical protein TNCV_1479111 [Trichonephila clavipes]|nr:hypothetical protein TNCV_1479111 [Trichonephila clavipes]